MSDDWFKSKIAPADAPEDGCHPDEAKALQAYYHKRSSVQEAAQAITQPVRSSENPHDNLYRLWSLLIDALVELPEPDISSLIQLLSAIQHLPETTHPTPFSWATLPGFGHMWADEHKQDHWRSTLSTTSATTRAAQRSKHIRTSIIEARLAVADIGSIPLDWGYDCIADALERHNAVLDFEIPAAAQWINIAGEQMYAGAVEGRESWALERKRDWGMEGKRMSRERWAFWGKRMEEVKGDGEVVVGAAEEAGKAMKVVVDAAEEVGRKMEKLEIGGG